MRTCERLENFSILAFNHGKDKPVVYIIGRSHWVVRWPCTKENRGYALKVDDSIDWDEMAVRDKEAADKWNAYTTCYPTQETEGLFPVVVEIIRGPEEVLAKGYQSW